MPKKRAFVRYNMKGKLVPGSLIVTDGTYPQNGTYQEVPTNLCCGSTTPTGPSGKGRNYYVSSSYTGTTSNGYEATPWKSLADVQANLSIINPGDQIVFKRGDTFAGTLSINKSGNVYDPIRFGNYGDAQDPLPKFTGTGAVISSLFSMYNQSYIEFNGLHITDPSISPTDRTIVANIQRAFVIDGPTGGHITIESCDIDLVGTAAYVTKAGFNKISFCNIGNLRMIRSDATLDNDYGANGVTIASANNRITNNYFYGCWANSIDYTYDGGAIEIYAESATYPVVNNFIGYNTIYDGNGACEVGGASATTIVNNITFAYNKFINNGRGILIQNSGTFTAQITNVNVYNNVFVETSANTHSTSASPYIFGFRATPTVANSLILKNNVVQLYGTIDVGKLSTPLNAPYVIHSNNVYKLGTGSVLNFTADSSEVTVAIGYAYWTNTTNPNPLNWDYTPLSSTVLIDTGADVGLTEDFSGAPVSIPPNIGILE